MNETAQIVIVTVITILTIVLTLVGVQLLLVLKELKTTISKANAVIDDARSMTTKLSHSTDSFSGLITGIKTALSLFAQFKKNNESK